ncbi:YihA family ribosome biogenesis GTP-binding protein [Patescibacteria group bacterium]|nr:YihA family ribosome biogenesis GTP-binding protein [Patescibacteria group bacterium]
MNSISAQFVKGVVGEDNILYDGVPQIAFIGRSNVGKSSTLNAILNRKKLVKVGRTPGKTKEVNFFDVRTDDGYQVYFVDLPGYGYAKLSKKERLELQNLISWYITHPEADTALICLIIDAKVGLTDLDKTFIKLIEKHSKHYVIGVNKVDKINQKAQNQLRKDLMSYLNSDTSIFYYSAETGKNVHHFQDYLLLHSS